MLEQAYPPALEHAVWHTVPAATPALQQHMAIGSSPDWLIQSVVTAALFI